MKKLEKLTLKELENSVMVMCDENQRAIVAGSDGDQIPPGMIEGITCTGSYNYYNPCGYSGGTIAPTTTTGTAGSSTSSNQSGGTGGGSPYGTVSSVSTTLCAYVNPGCSFADGIANNIIDFLTGKADPIVGALLGMGKTALMDKLNCERNEAIEKLLQAGITCYDSVHVNVILDDNYNVYIVGSSENFTFSTK